MAKGAPRVAHLHPADDPRRDARVDPSLARRAARRPGLRGRRRLERVARRRRHRRQPEELGGGDERRPAGDQRRVDHGGDRRDIGWGQGWRTAIQGRTTASAAT